MSFAVASLRSEGEILVEDVENVATSFPGFVEVARAAGLEVSLA
jgi:3-phosphoshikimate 1-carboxyvinyltransferase